MFRSLEINGRQILVPRDGFVGIHEDELQDLVDNDLLPSDIEVSDLPDEV